MEYKDIDKYIDMSHNIHKTPFYVTRKKVREKILQMGIEVIS